MNIEIAEPVKKRKPRKIKVSAEFERATMLTDVEVGRLIGYSHYTVWRKSREQADFPKPVKMGPKCTRWVRSEIEAWLAAKMSARNN